MELKHLASFIAVAEHLSFVRAAEQLHLSQPALSGQIRKLEEDLGVQLFRRNRRTVRITDSGRVFLAEARATLARAQQAVARVRKAERGEIGRLRVGFVSSAALEIVPSIVVAFRKQYPDVTLDLMNLRTSSQLKLLARKSIDVGFLRLPSEHRNYRRSAARGPCARARNKFRLPQLQNEHVVAYGRASGRWESSFCSNRSCSRNRGTPSCGHCRCRLACCRAPVAVRKEEPTGPVVSIAGDQPWQTTLRMRERQKP